MARMGCCPQGVGPLGKPARLARDSPKNGMKSDIEPQTGGMSDLKATVAIVLASTGSHALTAEVFLFQDQLWEMCGARLS